MELEEQISELTLQSSEQDLKIAELQEIADSRDVRILLEENKVLKERLQELEVPETEAEELEGENFMFSGSSKVILFASAKRGDGATSAAISLATALALKDEKTILVELSSDASLSDFFGIENVDIGLTECIKGLLRGNVQTADSAIIRFPQLKVRRTLRRSYSKIPKGFHVMTVSNTDRASFNPLRLSSSMLHVLVSYLAGSQKYVNIIFDIHGEDREMVSELLSTGDVNRLVVCLTQSASSVIGCRHLIQRISRLGHLSLVRSGYYILNKYVREGVDYSACAASSGLPKGRGFLIPEDRSGYLLSETAHLPYFVYGGKNSSVLSEIAGIV